MPHTSKSVRKSVSVSGPISMYTFRFPKQDHEVVIFGDMHFSYNNMCPTPCEKPDCETITSFIRRHMSDSRVTGRSLDVYLELPYVQKSGDPLKHKQLEILSKTVEHNVVDLNEIYGEQQHGVKGVIKRGVKGRKVGMGILGHLFKAFGKHVYDDVTKAVGNSSNVRFHYADARHEQNMVKMIPRDVDRLVARLDGDGSRMVRVLAAMIFGQSFGSSLPVEDRLDVFPDSLSLWRGRQVHKVAKQFLKLPPGMLKDRLRIYLEMRVNRVVPWIRQLKDTYASDPESSAEILVYIRSVLMDAYLICRMLHFAMLKRAVGGASIVYVGHAHAMEIVSFLQEYAQLPPELCDRGRGIDTQDVDKVQRCVHPRPCNTPGIKPGPSRIQRQSS